MNVRKTVSLAVVGVALVYAGFLVTKTVHNQHVIDARTARASGNRRQLAVGDLPGDVAPDFTLKTASGENITLSSLRGHGVWVNFWATWCPYCKKELSIVEQEHKILGSSVDVVGVDVQQSKTVVAGFAQSYGLTYPIALDTQGSVTAAYGVTGLPTSIFIGPHGVIRAVVSGAMQNMAMAQSYVRKIQTGNRAHST